MAAIISRKVMGSYQHTCAGCKGQWVSSDEKGGEEAKKHTHC